MTGPVPAVPVLAARAVTKSFGATPALQGADLTVAHGEVLAIMGPSGSGKSTLLHCLAGIQRPDGGEVWFDGTRTDQLGERARTELRRRKFGETATLTWRPPVPGYWAALAAGLALALLIVAATLPLLHRLTALDSARFE